MEATVTSTMVYVKHQASTSLASTVQYAGVLTDGLLNTCHELPPQENPMLIIKLTYDIQVAEVRLTSGQQGTGCIYYMIIMVVYVLY